MKRMTKKLLIAIISVILFTSIAMLLIPTGKVAGALGNKTIGNLYKQSGEYYVKTNNLTINDIISKNSDGTDDNDIYLYPFTSGSMYSIFNNKSIFCMQKGQTINSDFYKIAIDTKYIITNSYVLKNGTKSTDTAIVNYAQGLSYLFSLNNYRPDMGGDTANLHSDRVQLALWEYLRLGSSNETLSDFFNIPAQEERDSGTFGEGSHEKLYYDEACKYGTGVQKIGCSSEYYIINTSGKTQRLLIGESSETPPPPSPSPIPFNFTLIKNKPEGGGLAGAKFKIVITENSLEGTVIAEKTEVTNDYGRISVSDVTPTSNDILKIYIKITEQEPPPDGYVKLEPIIVIISRSSNTDTTWEINNSNGNGMTFKSETNDLTATIKEGTDITEIKLIKHDPSGARVANAKFKATVTNVGSVEIPTGSSCNIDTTTHQATITGLITKSTKDIVIKHIVPYNTDNIVKITLQEIESPTGYMKISDTTFSLKYDKGSGYWKVTVSVAGVVGSYSENQSKITITKIDPPTIRNLKLKKISQTAGTPTGIVSGATFDIKFQNIKNVTYNGTKRNASGSLTLSGVQTNIDGEINISEIVPISIDSNVIITITETGVPTGRAKLSGNIAVCMKYNTLNKAWGIYNTTSKKFEPTNYSYKLPGGESVNLKTNNSELTLTIEDYSIIKEININKLIEQTEGSTKVKDKNAEFNIKFTNVSKINGADYNSATGITIKTNNFGNINLKNIRIYNINNPIVITLEETKASTGRKKMNGKIKITLKYNPATGVLTKEDCTKDLTISDEEFNPDSDDDISIDKDTVNIKLADKAIIKSISLTKVDPNNGKNLQGTEFKVEITNAKEIIGISGWTSLNNVVTIEKIGMSKDEEGNVKLLIPNIVIADLTKEIKVTITETKAQVGYKIFGQLIENKLSNNAIVITLQYNPETGTLTRKSVQIPSSIEVSEVNVVNDTVQIKATDIPIMNLAGKVWEEKQFGSKTDGTGQSVAPNGIYRSTTDDKDDNDILLSGIKVSLYKAIEDEGGKLTKSEQKVKQDIYGQPLMEKTAKNNETLSYICCDGTTKSIPLQAGNYLFPNVEVGNYYIEFEYDGVTYIEYKEMLGRTGQETELKDYNELKDGTSIEYLSDANEIRRQDFNDEFSTITYGKASGGSKEDIILSYQYDTKNKKSVLQTVEDGDVKEDFKMCASIIVSPNLANETNTNYWKKTWNENGTPFIDDKHKVPMTDLDCALTKQEVDLNLMSNVDSATTIINGKKTKYTYQDLKNSIKINYGEKNTENAVTYNAYLYESDFNYRIGDYGKGSIANNTNTNTVGADQISNGNLSSNDELQVYVKYEISINNESVTTSKINEIVDYYDEEYTLDTVKYNKNKDLDFQVSKDMVTIDGKKYNKVTITGMSDEKIEFGGQLKLYLTFKVNKDDKGIILGEKSNIAEITSYSTFDKKGSAGMIDIDSAPGNYVIPENPLCYEDDTHITNGFKIEIKKKENKPVERTITGIVWDENINKNGQYDESESKINDVIVQLIEIKDIGEKRYEYIWQEMRSGGTNISIDNSDDTKYVVFNGGSIARKDSEVTGDGEYKFTGFIPGDYIIRYIYGDGSTYDYYPDDRYKNVQTYNGYDYQSTISSTYYNQEWLDLFKRTENVNSAVDNEARRLQVMAYSTTIDNTIGIALANKTDDALQATWMCAETPKLDISGEHVNTKGDEGGIVIEANQVPDYSINNLCFGLKERPKTKITLEKHITELKITATDGTVLVDTSNEMSTNLAKSAISNRTQRGTWTFNSDIEILQGATLEVQYEYTVKNESDVDYTSEDLGKAFEANFTKDLAGNIANTYTTWLNEKSEEIKTAIINKKPYTIGKYLGKYYYTGEKGSDDVEVTIQVDKMQEYVNDELSFNTDNSNSEFTKTNTVIKAGRIITVIEKGRIIKEDSKDINIIKEELKKSADLLTEESLTKEIDFNTVLQNKVATGFLTKGKTKTYNLTLTRVLSPNTTDDMNYESYLADITQYSIATGRRDMASIPDNLSYRHSKSSSVTLESGLNEPDETWAETITITPPTGEDKQNIIEIAILVVSSIALLAGGIVVIKKYVVRTK